MATVTLTLDCFTNCWATGVAVVVGGFGCRRDCEVSWTDLGLTFGCCVCVAGSIEGCCLTSSLDCCTCPTDTTGCVWLAGICWTAA